MFARNRKNRGADRSEENRKPFLRVESLEGRVMMTGVPDLAGDTVAGARAVSVPYMHTQRVTDVLPLASDVDYFKVDLKKGDYFIADVDPNGKALNTRLFVMDKTGAPVGSPSMTEPETGAASNTPAIGFYAQNDGPYYVKVISPGPFVLTLNPYSLNLTRIGIDNGRTAASLAQSGAFHAWLNQSGDTLNITGPEGYGFSLRGTWTKTSSTLTGKTTYSASGALFLKTSTMPGSTVEIPLQVPARDSLRVITKTPGWAQLGELDSVQGKLGLSLAPIAATIKQVFGLDVTGTALAASWTIKTGAQIKSQYANVVQRDIEQLLDGVPYLVYGDKASSRMSFGGVSAATTNQDSLILIADPSDPFLYVQYKDYAAAGSVHGRIPLNAEVGPRSAPGTTRSGADFGHVFAAGNFPLAGIPVSISGEVTANLDANGDGLFLGGAGNANQLFRGELGAAQNVLKDVNISVHGAANAAFKVGNVAVTVPLSTADVYYGGLDQTVWFKGSQDPNQNLFQGTVLKDFKVGPSNSFQGQISRNGQFSVSATSQYRFFNADAQMTLTVTNTAIQARGDIKTPIATAHVIGNIGIDGSFRWTGTADVHIGSGSNAITGTAGFVLTRVGSAIKLELDLNCTGKFTIPSVQQARGSVTGRLTATFNANGSVTFNSTARISGSLYQWIPDFNGGHWAQYASLSTGLSISNNKLKLNVGGQSFSISL